MTSETTVNVPQSKEAIAKAEIKKHNQAARNIIHPGFIPTPKDKEVSDPEVGKGFLLKHNDKELQLDIMFIQRGEDKGHKYHGLQLVKESEEDTTKKLEEFTKFYGAKYVASRLETIYNTENQRFCLGSDNYKAITPEDELKSVLATRTVRDEDSKAKLLVRLSEISLELKKAQASETPNPDTIIELMTKLSEIAGKLSEK